MEGTATTCILPFAAAHVATSGRLLLEAFDSNWIAPLGPHVDAFEREFAAQGRRRARPWPSPRGTAALHLSLLLLGVGPRRRGAHLDADLRRHGQRDHLRRRHAGLHRQRPRHLEHGPRPAGRGTARPAPAAEDCPRR